MAYFSYICAYICYNLDILPSYYHETIPIIKQHLRLDSLCDCSRNVYPYARTDGELLGLRRIHFVGIQCSPDASSPILLPIPRMSLT